MSVPATDMDADASPSAGSKSKRKGRGKDAVPPARDVDLRELLSTCVDACRRGCEVIRNVRHRSLRSPEVLDNVTYKILDDPRSALTEADGASQKVIVECLNRCWEREIECGRLRIVGEEDEDHYSTDLEGEKSFDTAYSEDIMNHFDNYGSPRPDLEPVRRDMFGEGAGGRGGGIKRGRARQVCSRTDEVIVFIDPMDGTREFVEGRVRNVQCLIGITVNGRPVAGAMGLPMVHGDRIEVAYGLISHTGDGDSSSVVPILSGVEFFHAANPLDASEEGDSDVCCHSDVDDGDLRVFSGDSKKPALRLAMDCIKGDVLGGMYPRPPVRRIVAGGCGNKLLSVQRHYQRLRRRREEGHLAASSIGGCCIDLPFGSPAPPPMVGAISVAAPGSSSWDTAAPTAVLLAADPEARVTDLLGRPLVYDGENLSNDRGVVVSSGCVASSVHEGLCARLSRDAEFRRVIGVDDVNPADSAESR